MSKQELGFSDQRERVEVDIPSEVPDPWDARAELRRVGQPAPRVDGPAKVTGAARYTTDVRLPGMLHAEVARSPHPAAIVRSVDVARAAKMPGVRAVHVVAKAGDRVRYEGQEIAAVAADTLHHARDAVRAIAIVYDVQPHVTDLVAAQAKGAPAVYDDGNFGRSNNRGEPLDAVAKALADPRVVAKVEGTFTTQVQTHSALEPHGSVVRPTAEGGFEVWSSTQSIASVVGDVASAFDLSPERVRVYCDYLGGGFGAKFGAGAYTIIAAHLARKAKAPVRLFHDRRVEHLAGGNRPSSRQTLRAGATKDGKLVAMSLDATGSAGVGNGAGTGAFLANLYDIEHRGTVERDVFTNAGAGAAFRAPGHPQGCFGVECTIDDLAARLGLDPIDVRLANDPHPVRRHQWAVGRERFGWAAARSRARDTGPLRRGVGCASSVWYNIVEEHVGATVDIHPDGSVSVCSAVQDIGSGIRTIMAQVVAEVLGLETAQITVRIGDSRWPLGPGSGGSKTTASLTPAVHQAAVRARDKLASLASAQLGAPAHALVFAGGRIQTRDGKLAAPFATVVRRIRSGRISGSGERGPDLSGVGGASNEALRRLARFIAGVQLAEVEVDVETGVVRVLRVLAVHDAGRVMNPLLARSQVNGGVIQGISYALHEERVLDRLSGAFMNANLESYRITSVREIPPIDVVFTDVWSGLSSTGAMGLGEPATIPTAAAVANAVFHATGTRVRDLPMSPEVVLGALRGVS